MESWPTAIFSHRMRPCTCLSNRPSTGLPEDTALVCNVLQYLEMLQCCSQVFPQLVLFITFYKETRSKIARTFIRLRYLFWHAAFRPKCQEHSVFASLASTPPLLHRWNFFRKNQLCSFHLLWSAFKANFRVSANFRTSSKRFVRYSKNLRCNDRQVLI